MSEIKELVDNHTGKKNHFLLKLPNESIHMKCDKDAEKDKWVDALRKCMDEVAKFGTLRDPRSSHKDSIEPSVLKEIMEEQESS